MLVLTLAVALLAPTAHAGERLFAYSYGYGSVPKGGIELETYTTAHIVDGAPPKWEHQAELEYGISNRLESGLYLVETSTGGGPLAFGGFKGRLKYTFGSEGVLPVDSALYLEYIGSPDFATHGVEAKVILGKDVKRFHSALNVEYTVTFGEEHPKHEIEPSLGLGFKVGKPAFLGGEAGGEVEQEGGAWEGPKGWAGPTLHLAGEGGRFWWTLAALAPIGKEAAEDHGVMVRSLAAINL